MDDQRQRLPRLRVVVEPDEIERLGAVELERRRGRAGRKLARQHAHADEVAAMDALEAVGDDRAHAEEARAFRGPVARAAGAVFLARRSRRAARARLRSASRRRKSIVCSPLGWCIVTPPSTPGTIRFFSRTFANVPRIITSWFMRRAP